MPIYNRESGWLIFQEKQIAAHLAGFSASTQTHDRPDDYSECTTSLSVASALEAALHEVVQSSRRIRSKIMYRIYNRTKAAGLIFQEKSLAALIGRLFSFNGGFGNLNGLGAMETPRSER